LTSGNLEEEDEIEDEIVDESEPAVKVSPSK
jgi:hypothetical protein